MSTMSLLSARVSPLTELRAHHRHVCHQTIGTSALKKYIYINRVGHGAYASQHKEKEVYLSLSLFINWQSFDVMTISMQIVWTLSVDTKFTSTKYQSNKNKGHGTCNVAVTQKINCEFLNESWISHILSVQTIFGLKHISSKVECKQSVSLWNRCNKHSSKHKWNALNLVFM